MNTNPLREMMNERDLSKGPGTMEIAHKKKDGSVVWKKHKFPSEAAALRYLGQLKGKRGLYDSRPFKPGE